MLRQPHHKYTAITRWRKTRLITISLFVVILSILSLSISGTASAQGQSLSDQFPFSSDTLNGETVSNPTSLQFGPDNRLYISQQNAVIYAYTIERDNAAPGFGEYTVSSVETINLIKFNTPNHNDDGTPNGTTNRQVTGILVAGTATNPVLYVTSSDWRIAVGDDVGLDTNSGVLTRLTWNGSSWDKVDLVRGLARSEENHSTNGMALDESTNTLYVMSGGHANKGAPGNNLSGTPEYWTSAAMLSVDLDALNAMPVYTDSRTNTQFVYDLPNLDDPTRTNILGSANGYPSNHPLYNEMVDPGDPFGGNNGLNQAITIPDGPVQIYSPGYRNGYDVVFTEAERLYTWDNGPNGGWGGLPVLRDSGDNLVNYTTEATYETAYQPGSGVYCTNEFNENVSNGHGDPLAFVTGPGYYGGHPTPIRAFPGLAGVIAYMEQGNGNWVQVGPTYDFEDLLPDYVTNASGYSFSSWFPNNPVECTYTSNDSDRYLAIVNASTNGLTEYTASNFDGGMQGDLLAASFNDNIYLVQLDENGDADPADFSSTGSALFSGLPNNPLDVTAQGDDDIFPGTIWAATHGASNVMVFEPADYGECEGTNDPNLDEDFDGYDNADEILNGTSPCNGGDKPADVDGDLESDLLDNDDDNDGVLDVDDAFQIDPNNGLTTNLPLNLPFQNNDPGTGFFGIGLTGLMTNGTTDYLDMFDPENMTVGGAGGKFTIDAFTDGDAHQAVNDQDYAFQVGVNVDNNSNPFTVHTQLESDYFVLTDTGTGTTPENYESYGMYIGTGDQDNYLKIVLRGNNSGVGFQVLLENGGATSQNNYNVANILIEGSLDLFFQVDPSAGSNGTAQPAYSLDGGATLVSLGSPINLPAGWLDPNDDQGLAVGLISTSTGGTDREVGGSWAFLTVLESGPAVDKPLTDVEVLVNSDPLAIELNNVFVDDGGLGNLDFSVSNVQNPSLFDPQPNISQSGDTISLNLSFAIDAVGTSEITITATDENGAGESASDTFLVTVLDEAPILYRLNTGGPTIATIDDGPDWITDVSGQGATYLVEGGDNTFGPSGGSVYTGPVIMTDPSLPSGVPSDIFEIERWDPTAAPEMTYAFPATAGSQATVRLYFAELFTGVTGAGQRVFDVSVEGSVPSAFNNVDAFATAGAKGAIMVETTVTVGPDGDIDLVFIHDVENPAIKGIEILGVTDGNVDNPPVVNAFGTQTNNEGDTPDLYVEATDDGASMTFGATGLPTGLDMEITNGHIFGTIADGAAGNSPYNVTISVDDGVNSPVEFNFVWNVLDPNISGAILYRVNNGGPEVAALDGGPVWSEDQVPEGGTTGGSAVTGTPSPYVNSPDTNNAYATDATVTLADSVPAGIPASLFQTERWDPLAAPEMQWAFPVVSGTTVEVRLYFAEVFATTAVVGGRVFDVSVEGTVPAIFTDLEPYSLAGNQQDVGSMVSYITEITDGVLNLEFIHGTENPAVKAIEIIDVTPTGGNEAPTVLNAIPDITILENETISDINLLAPQVFEDDVDGAPYMLYDASSDNIALVDVSVDTTTLSFTVGNGTGTANITVTAEDSEGLIGTDTFLVTVEVDDTDNPPVVEVEILDVTVDENAAPVIVDLAAAFEDDVTLDADLDYSVMSNSNLPLVGTGISGTELTLTFSADMFGTADIEVKAEDELGQSITDTFTVTVNEVPDNFAPVADNGGIPDETAEENDGPITIALGDYFSDVEDADVDLTFNVVGNTNLPLVSTNIVAGDLTLTLATDMFGTANISVTATDTEGATSTPDLFVLTVNEYDPQDIVLYRVNNGGPVITDTPIDWSEDQAATAGNANGPANPGTPSPYLVNVASGDTTFAPDTFTINNDNTTAPPTLFATERYSAVANPNNMQWEFPATQSGWYQVNLYFAENWTGAQTAGVRVFDVQIEGNTVLDNYDVFVAAGAINTAVVESIYVEITDGTLDLDFIKTPANNPSIKGIEVILLGAPPANMPPTVDAPLEDVEVFVNSADTIINLDDYFSDPEALALSYGANVVSSSPAGLVNASITDSTLTLSYTTDTSGVAVVTITATDSEAQSVSDTFSVTVIEPDPVDNTAPIVVNPIDEVTVNENSADTVIDISTVFFDAQQPANTLNVSAVSNNGALVGATVSGTDLTLIYTPDSFGVAAITVTAEDNQGETVDTVFAVVVNEVDDRQVFFRVNTGGPELPAADGSLPVWSVDNNTTPSPYRVAGSTNISTGTDPINMSDPSVAGGPAPAALFQTERWDNANGAEMKWEFPVDNGTEVEVRLYFAEIYNQVSLRVFDVSVEGNIPPQLDDINPTAIAGADGAFMRSVIVTSDGMIDIEFLHLGNDNPAIKGIEILEAPAGNTPPTVANPIPNVTVAQDSADELLDLSAVFTDLEDGSNLTLSVENNTNSALVTVDDSNIGTSGEISLSFAAGASGMSAITVRATDSGTLFAEDIFLVTVNAEQDLPEILYRVNAGGDLVASTDSGPDWSADTSGSPSPYVILGTCGNCNNTYGGGSGASAGNPTSAPTPVFQNERWDNTSAPTMQWEFPVANGDYIVNLYFVEAFATASGARVFDVNVEGALTLDDYDIFVAAGGTNIAVVESVPVTVIDGIVNIEFVHGVIENPKINAIEILEAPVNNTNTPPTVINPIDDISVEENGTIATIDVSNVFDDADLPTDTLTLSVLSTNDTLVDAVLNGTDLELTLGTDESGIAAISLKATDEAGASATDTFIVTVTPPDVVNTPPTVADAINDIVQPFGTTSDNIPLTDVFTDAEQDDATLTLGILGISNLTLFDNVTVNGSTLEITYATGVSGTSNITVRATDNGGLSATNTFAVTVQPDDTPDNNPPTVVSPILDVSHIVNEVTSEIIDLTDVFADVEDDDIPTPLNLVVLSNSNLGLVDASISGTDLTLTYTPNVVSSATLTVRAFDSNGGFVDDSFVVTINAPANTPPTVANPLTDPTEYELGAEDNIISLVGLFTDVEQDDATLALAVTDVGNAALITSANVLGSDLILTYGGIVGESTVTITATDNEAASTPFTFTVIVSSSDTNISVIKTAPQSVLVGDQFIYTIDVTNNGLAIAQDVKITDILPGGVEFVSFNPADPICSEVNGVVICNIAQIGAGETETIEITVEAVSASQFYQLSATNSAPFTVPNLTLTHTIPDSLTFVNVVPSDQCVFNENNNTITCSFGSTAPGVTKFATVEVTTNEPSIITNTAIVSADNADTVASNQAITTVEATDIVLDASALVEITPGGGLGASTFGGSSIQITNNSADGVNITGISIDFSTAILPDMVFDPVGAGGDATASCFTANVGGAAVGVVAPADPCVDPYTVPRNGGFDVMTLAFTDFGAGEYFAFTTDVDPNSIKDVPGAGNAGAVSGYELTGSTVTVTFSDGSSEQILVASIYEDGSLGGGQAVVANDALDAPTIALLGYPTTPVTVNDTAQTVQVTGTPGANVSLLLMDTRLYIATGAPPFGVTDTTYYANEAMSGKTLYTGVIPAGGTLNVPVTLLQTASGDATPDGGLNRIVAVLSDAPYAADTLVSQTSNFLVVKYDPDLVSPGIVFDPATITVNVVAGESTTIDITADSSDASTLPSPVAILDFDDATNLDADWLSTTSAMTQGVSYELTIDATSLVAGTTLTGRLEGTVAGYEIGILPITLNVVETAGDGVATVSITPGGGLGSTVYGGTDKLQISNNSPAGSGVQITSISIDLGTGILPDMVWDPIGTGGDATAQCFTASGAATTVGLVTPADPCVTPFSVPRQGGFDVITLNFTGFDPGENFSFSTDIDPNSIQGVPGAGNAGAVSGYELIGSTVTVSFSDGSVVTTSLFEDGSLGGGSAVAAANAPATPGIAVLGVSPTPAIVNTLNQTVIVTGTPGASVSLLQMDARLYIASGNPAFNVSDTTFYANEAMSGKTVYTGTIGLDGTLSIPVTLLQTAGATGTPDGGLNHFIAVIESGVGEQTSQTSNTVILKYDPDYTGPALVITPETLAFAVQADIITGDSFVVSTSDSSVVTGVALTAEDATLSAPAWLTIPATTDTGVAQNLTVDTTGLSDGLYTATVTASAAGYLPVNMQVSVTVGTVSSQAICINAGGPAYTTVADSFFPAGVEFLADSTNVSPYFDSGSKSTFTNPSIVLTNSNNPPLFTTERSATANLVPFNFALDVNPGQYLVQMYFADIYFGATGGGGRDPNDGQRVFDLTVEPGTANEVLLLDDYDLNADVGPETVVLHQGIFTVSDSQLNINFTPSVDQAKISALCVTPVTGGGNIAPTINPIADATVSEGEIFATTVSAFDSEIVSLSATVEDALAAPVSATIVDNGNNTASISIPTVVGDAGDVYTVTVSADDGVNPVATETFLVYVIPVSENEPSAEILITDGVTDNLQSWNDTSTYGGDSFTIQNTGDVNITSVAFNVSTTYMPDIVFDPVAHGGDTVAKCFDANTGAATVGLVTADGACGVPPFGLPNLDQQAGDTDPDAGYFGLTITFDDFNPTELFGFSVDMDPSSIKGDTTPGGSGGISGMELIGSTVTVTFEDGTIITAPVWLDGVQSNAGGRVVIGQFAPVAPSISMVGLTTPTTTNVLSQMVQVLGTPNAPFTLLQVDGRLHIDSGSANGDYPNGYDIDPYEANESIGKSVYTGTLNGSGVAMVPLNLLLTTQTYGGPDGGINHFIAVINGLNGQTSGTSNVLVVEYDPNFNGGNNTPPVVTNPGTQTSQSGVPITPLQIVATAPEIDQTLAFSATGLPQGLSINPGTGVISGTPTCAVVGGAGAFQESQSGLFSIEVESVPPTDDWTIETAVNGASGDYYEWQNGSTFTGIVQPGQGVLSYPVEIETPGRYRFLWRTAAPNSTEHNDTWVRVTGAGSDAVGVQGSTEIQIGNGQGWIKVYQNSSGNNWAWVANTVDNDAHQIYFDFATAGVYTVEFSARSTLHKLDRWVLYNSSYSQGQATSLNVPISQREQQGGSDNCTYDVEITVIDNGTPIGVTITEFQWNVTTDVVVENVAPTANVGSYANPILDTDTLVGETVILDGSGSSDSDGTIVTYNWTVNGSPVNQNTDTPTVNLNDGANTVSLIVIDDDGASSAPSATTINIQAYVPPGECGGLVVEAESGELSGNFVIGNDANASGGQYVHAPQLSGNSSVPSNNHHVTLCF
ncbi:MAG: malectin domain-containing carbohydrate-binding protein, partial [Aggregatilineales bacterium]